MSGCRSCSRVWVWVVVGHCDKVLTCPVCNITSSCGWPWVEDERLQRGFQQVQRVEVVAFVLKVLSQCRCWGSRDLLDHKDIKCCDLVLTNLNSCVVSNNNNNNNWKTTLRLLIFLRSTIIIISCVFSTDTYWCLRVRNKLALMLRPNQREILWAYGELGWGCASVSLHVGSQGVTFILWCSLLQQEVTLLPVPLSILSDWAVL